jgi:P27 family predicted phage terminase small subunit
MGRRPKPASLREAQGNPSKRDMPQQPAIDATAAAAPHAALGLKFAKLKGNGRKAYDVIGAELRRLNFVRPSDEPLLARYCKSLADFWDATTRLDALGSPVYDCPMTNSDKTMARIHPLFMVQERLAKRLESMEDRLGLSPQARQQYLLRMASTGAQTALPLPVPTQQGNTPSAPMPNGGGNPVGLLSRPTPPPSALN